MNNGWLWEEKGWDLSEEKKSNSKSKKSTIGGTAENPLSVEQLNRHIKQAIDAKLSTVWVEAEISNLARPASGHVYLTLKDVDSEIRAVMWRSTASRIAFELEDGLSVLASGKVDVYSPRGTYQLIVQKIQPKGVGALQLAFQQLQARLAKEGLFDHDRKRPLPPFPSRIGVVTSPTGAAIRDFLEVLRRRWNDIEILVIPTRVQGEGAGEEIADAIRMAQDVRPKLDALVITRGGGSIEDLWSFNEEVVVRAVANSIIPTVSGIGHEIDLSLTDLAADLHALTPSEAAERLTKSATEIRTLLESTEFGISQIVEERLHRIEAKLKATARTGALREPEFLVQRLAQKLDERQMRLQHSIDELVRKDFSAVETIAKQLDALSPLKTLSRGYSVVRDPASSRVVNDSSELSVGDELQIIFDSGRTIAEVKSIEDESKDDNPVG